MASKNQQMTLNYLCSVEDMRREVFPCIFISTLSTLETTAV